MFDSLPAALADPGPPVATLPSRARPGCADARLARVLAGAPDLLHAARVLRARPAARARVELARIAALPPSATSLAALQAIDVERLDAYDRVSWLTLWERHRGWFDAHAQRAIVAVGGASPPPAHPRQSDNERDDTGREQVALALRLSSATGGARLDTARQLTSRLRRTLEALASGQLTYWHAKAIADAVAPLSDAAAAAVERAALDKGPSFETLTQFRTRVARAVIAADPKTADEQHLAAVAGRRVIMWREPHGMATVASTLTAAEAATMMAAVTALAHLSKADGDDRPMDVLRADALAGLMASQLAQPGLPSQQRARPQVGVTIDAATIAGLADHPGHLDGYGPIPPVMARQLAADGDWHRLVTDPITGALLDYGRTIYRPDAELAEFITARDRTCRFPTCARPARLCDIDHAQPYNHTDPSAGGATSSANCGSACRRNHQQKTAGDLLLISHPDGSATWTTQAGHTYHRPAIDHCPEHTQHLRAIREREPDRPDRFDAVATIANDNDAPAATDTSRGRSSGGDVAATPSDPQVGRTSGNDPPPF